MECEAALVGRQTEFDGYVGKARSQWPSAFPEFTFCLSTGVGSTKGKPASLATFSTVGALSKDIFHVVVEEK